MRNNTLTLAIALAVLGAAATATAGEGMWVPQQLPEISPALKQAGLKLDPQQLANLTGDPLGAVVSLGGCTASFVSSLGLVATNHHCAYGAIQLNSTPERNLLQDGFNAERLRDELSAGPNARIYVLDDITDVSERVKAAIAAAPTALARTLAVEALEKTLVAECEASGVHRCRLYSFFDGNDWRLFKNLEIRDVRLAYAPPSSIGAFGGDVDNWMWPRHTGDFAFYRAYVGKDGKPAAYSRDNVPYQPRHWLKIADKPLREGDFVMVAGYPGRTNRYALTDEFANTAEWAYPTISAHYRNLVALANEAGKRSPEIEVKYASTQRGWENVMKNYDGQLEGFARIDAAASKAREEREVLAWLAARGEAGREALAAHARLQALNSEARATRERDLVMRELGGALGNVATLLYRLAIEKQKPDLERQGGYQSRDEAVIEGSLRQMERRYDARMDRQLQRYWLLEYLKLPAAQRVAAIDAWLGGNDEAAVDAAIARINQSTLKLLDARLRWFKAGRGEFERSRDPAIQYAVAVMPTLLALQEEAKTRAGESLLARPVYMRALMDYRASRGEAVYPDANSSLRITFGQVTGYTRSDGSVQPAFTRLEEIPAKDTGTSPFDSPKPLLEAIAGKRYGGYADAVLGTVPVNFLSDLDITGGNSGSPVLDGEGKLVGLAFDGNWESVSSNWVFDPRMTRMISVDHRYMRWVMQEVFPAPFLLQEMGVPVQPAAKPSP